MALVVGEDGVGKTSLARELARVARDRGVLVLWAQCDASRGATAYWPWTQVLRSLAIAAVPAVG
jgi:predicted ATPase